MRTPVPESAARANRQPVGISSRTRAAEIAESLGPGAGGHEPTERSELPAMRNLNHLLHRSAQQADALVECALSELQLTARQFVVLDCIYLTPATNQVQLGQSTGIDRSTLVNIIDRLERRGLLQRRKSTIDRRESVLLLTTEGAAVLAAARPAVRETNTNLIGSMPADLRDAFLEGLERLVHLGDGDESGP